MTLAVSSWALHRAVRASRWDSPREAAEIQPNESGTLHLLDLPAELRRHGFDRLELCHFHLTSRERPYLEDFRASLAYSSITLQTLLIDDGDLSDEATAQRDRDWIAGWVETAAELGSQGARVIAGKQSWNDRSSELSIGHLASLTGLGPRIRIENWFDLLHTPEQAFTLLDRLDGKVGLCMDYGNWGGETKYDDLARIAPRAETCHAKSEFLDATNIDEDDYGRCLELSARAGYDGPYVLVNGGPEGDPWGALQLQAEFIQNYRSPQPYAAAG